jgi:hypothetical protein
MAIRLLFMLSPLAELNGIEPKKNPPQPKVRSRRDLPMETGTVTIVNFRIVGHSAAVDVCSLEGLLCSTPEPGEPPKAVEAKDAD